MVSPRSRTEPFSRVKFHLKMAPNEGCLCLSIHSREWQRKCMMTVFPAFNKTLLQIHVVILIYSSWTWGIGIDGKRFGVKFFKKKENTSMSSAISDSSKTTKEINSRSLLRAGWKEALENDLEIFIQKSLAFWRFQSSHANVWKGFSFVLLNNWIPESKFQYTTSNSYHVGRDFIPQSYPQSNLSFTIVDCMVKCIL